MMDKKTIWVVAACLLALIGWQWIVSKLYPPVPKQAKPPAAVTLTNKAPAAAAATFTNTPTITAPVKPDAPEQTAVLENEFIRVTFTSWGGGIRQIELLKHRNNGSGNVLLNAESSVPALALRGQENAAFALEKTDTRTVVFRGPGGEKRFTLGDEYTLTGAFRLTSTNSAEIVVGSATSLNGREPPDLLTVGWLVDTKYFDRGLKQTKNGAQQEVAAARWGAVKNQFFTMLLTPGTNAAAVAYESRELALPADWSGKTAPHAMTATLTVPVTADGRVEFSYFAGPKELKRLLALGNGQEEVMHFGFWGAISIVLLRSMNFFHRAIPNYGVAIILITICIKILFWPIQAKSIKSMKQMQKFQPLMTKLREKYKDDPQRMNAEMMKLYQEHKINPFAGCLPMLVQIPVFFAFYTMLRSAVELRGAPFLWIKDLAQPDTIFHLASFPFNPLPLLMGVSMVFQMKLTPQTGDNQQQKMMMFMPLVFLFICYNMASGLVLYWTVQQLLSIAQQWWSLRQTDTEPVVLPPAKTK